MSHPLAIATDGYLSPLASRTIAIVSRGYLIPDEVVVEPEVPTAGGGGGAPPRIARRPLTGRGSLPKAAIEIKRRALDEIEKQISVKTIRKVVEKVAIEQIDLPALRQAVIEARSEAPVTTRKLVLDIVPGDITLPMVEPGSDLNLRLLLLMSI